MSRKEYEEAQALINLKEKFEREKENEEKRKELKKAAAKSLVIDFLSFPLLIMGYIPLLVGGTFVFYILVKILKFFWYA